MRAFCAFSLAFILAGISNTVSASAITVNSPNGGETITETEIDWSGTGPTGVDILLLKGGSVVQTLTTAYSFGAPFYWTPSNLAAGNDYKIRVRENGNAANFDDSDGNFTIPEFVDIESPYFLSELASNRTHQVYYRAVGGSTVKIELYQNDQLVSTIAASANNTGNYAWAIPANQPAGENYVLRITCPPSGTAYDEVPIIIGAPFITVVRPSDPDSFALGSSTDVYWMTNVPETFTLEVLKGAAVHETLSTNVYNYYYWDIPAAHATGNDFKVRVTSNTDPALTDSSDSFFTISAPAVTVIAPNGGEALNIGTSFVIRWSKNFSDTVKIELLKGGALDRVIDADAFGTIYNWQIPGDLAAGSDYTIRLTQTNSPAPATDVSDANFTISSVNATVTAPNGGESWAAGEGHSIEWTSTTPNAGVVDIELWDDQQKIATIATGYSNSGSYYWTIPFSLQMSANRRIKVGSDFSDAPFTIAGALQITYPGGSSYELGSGAAHQLAWQSNAGGDVKIEVFENSNPVETISAQTPNDGSFSWNCNLPDSFSYEMRITVVGSNSEIQGVTYFSVKPETVTVSVPNGGEKYVRGYSANFSWQVNVQGSMRLEFAGAQTIPVTEGPFDGNYQYFQYTIPAATPLGDYRLRVTNLQENISDESDAVFSIVDPGITVDEPNTATTIYRGTQAYLYWTSNFSGGEVTIELLKGGVVQAPPIATDVYNGGYYQWSVPVTLAAGTDYRIRITHETQPTAVDTSDVDFTIAPVAYAVTAPNGGENWQLESTRLIQWTSTPSFVGNVKIDLYKAGAFLRNIAASEFNGGAYGWAIPGDLELANDYRIRITSTTDSAGFDESDANFRLVPKLAISAPNGGEYWPKETTQTITWLSEANPNNHVRIELLDSGNIVALTIADDTPDTGLFNWSIPLIQDGSYKIRITRLDDGSINDVSDNYFYIDEKYLALYQPTGGNHIPLGYPYEIQWSSNLGGQCRIELLKGGAVSETLAASVANAANLNVAKFVWNVTQALGNDYRIRITSLLDNSMVAESSSDFAIENPSISVSSPTLNQQVVASSAVNVLWTTNFIAPIEVALLKNGSVAAILETNGSNDGFFVWNVPFAQQPGADYQIRVRAMDNSVSNSGPMFEVVAQTLRVVSPNGGEHWSIGTSKSVELNTNANVGTVNIDLLKNGVVVRNIFTGASLGSYSYGWQVPTDLEIGTDYRVRATHATQPALTDSSDADFSLVPKMQVIAPVGGVAYPGTTQEIRWLSGETSDVKIELLPGPVTLFAATVNDGTEMWNVPTEQTEGFYSIRVTSLADGAITDTGGSFRVEPKRITVNQPYSQDYARGYGYPITWTTNFSGNVKIELASFDAQNNETVVDTVSANAPNAGSFGSWTIPANLQTGTRFKIKISHLVDPVVAYSPEFSISDPRLTLVTPNGSESWVRGTQNFIAWTTNFPGSVKLDLLQGANTQSITATTQNSGGFNWTLPTSLSNGDDYKVRVSTLDDAVSDSSDAAFSIVAHNVAVTTPNGGEKFSLGTQLLIQWSSNFAGAYPVKIELLKNNVPAVIDASAVNAGSYGWMIPNNQATGTDFRVRVTSTLDAAAFDVSDADFEIRPNQPPAANAGPDQSIKETRIGFARVTLTGGASTDDGPLQPLTYTWRKGASVVGTGVTIQPELPLGDNTITLTVNDGQYDATDDVIVSVLANEPPTANAGADQSIQQSQVDGAPATLSSLSTDDGSISTLTYVWKEGATTLSTQASFTQTFAVGDHTLTLTVNDGQYEASDTVLVRVLPVPNLIVESIVVPQETYTGLSFDLTWTVKNTGAAAAVGPWSDHVYFSEDDQPGNDTDLGIFVFDGTLDPGQSVTRTQVLKIANRPGFEDKAYRILVVADGLGEQSNNLVYEGPYENDNVTASALFNVHPLPLPDLIVESLTAPATAFSGQTVTVQYVIFNQGTGGTDLPVWYDRLYVSVDNNPDGGDLYQTAVANVASLAPGERYTGTVSFHIQPEVSGPFNIIIRANDDGQHSLLEEDSTNNTKLKPLYIDIPSLPDLQITQAAGSEDGFSGEQIFVSWTVENKGPVPAEPTGGTITDRIYLSQDTIIETDKDYYLGEFTHGGTLAPGESYAQRNQIVTLPGFIGGPWHILIVTDANSNVFEHAGEGNNVRELPINVIQSPAPDLIVASATPPANGSAGHDVAVNWTIRNQGGGDAEGVWSDSIYLSTDRTLSADDIFLARFFESNVQAGKDYSKSATVTVPIELNGDYYIVVYTDAPGPNGGDALREFDTDLDAEANNTGASVAKINLTWSPPDLQVTSVTAPATGLASKAIDVSWTVRNFGTGDTVAAGWSDSIYLSESQTLEAGTAIKIGQFSHDGKLNPNATYSRAESVGIPVDAPAGNYYLHVLADSGSGVTETGLEDNNSGRTAITIQVASTPPNLVVASVNAPAAAGSGKNIDVSWTVQNTGAGPTVSENNSWIDQAYLSQDLLIDNNDIRLTNNGVGHGGVLQKNASYPAQISYKLPYEISGTWYVLVRTDEVNAVYESTGENDNVRASAAINLTITPAPDLKVQSIQAQPASALSGQFVQVTYTVKNDGVGATDADTPNWSDNIYLSRDQVLDASDARLASSAHTGSVAPAGTYTKIVEVELPQDISGPYNLFVKTDVLNQIFESNDGNNFASAPLGVTLAPPADFIVTSVSIPVAGGGLPGESRSFGWIVKNAGPHHAVGNWTDNVYLSRDTAWDFQDRLIGSVVQTNRTLEPNDSYSESLTAGLPALVPGNYYVIVRSDVRNNVRETDDGNNAGASAQTIFMDVPELTLGVAASGNLTQNAERYYKVNVPDKGDLLITLDSQSTQSFNDLFAAQAFMPTQGLYEFAHDDPFRPDQTILIPETIGGYYYILVRGNRVPDEPVPYTITAKVLDFSIVDVSPNRGSNAGKLTTQIRGAKFTGLSTAALVDSSGNARAAERMYFVNGTRIFATFDLRGLTPGLFDVRVNDQAKSVVLDDGFTVTEPSVAAGPVLAAIFSPAGLRIGTVAVLTVGYSNTGENDLDAPLFRPYSDHSRMRLTSDGEYDQHGEDIIGINFKGPAGIVAPGARASISYAYTSLEPEPIQAHHKIPQFTTANNGLMDWRGIEQNVRPDTATDAQWNPTWQKFTGDCGPLFGGFVSVMGRAATTASERQQYLFTVADLFPFAVLDSYKSAFYNVNGRVFIEDYAHPLASVRINAVSASAGVAAGGESEADGTFQMFQVPQGEFTFAVDGYIVKDAPALKVGANVVSGVTILVTRGAVVEGAVRTEDGAPIKGLTVTANDAGNHSFSVSTDANGFYKLGGLAAGTYSISVDGGHVYASAAEDNLTLTASQRVEGLDFNLARGGTLTGTVVSSAGGAPLANARISLVNGELKFGVATNAGGEFELNKLDGGDYELRVTADGFAPAFTSVFNIKAGTAREETFTLQPESTLTVQINDDQGAALDRANVQLLIGEEAVAVILTGSDGRAVFKNLAAADYKVDARKLGFGEATDSLSLGAGENQPLTLVLQKQGSIGGKVTRGATGAEGIEVVAISANGFSKTGVTDANGDYLMRDIAAGSYAVMLSVNGTTGVNRTNVAIDAANLEKLDVNFMISGAEIHGALLDANSVLIEQGGTVSLVQNGRVIANAPNKNGSYAFVAVAPGDYTIEAAASNATFAPIDVTVAAAQILAGADMRAGNATVTGTIRDTNSSNPINGALVNLRSLAAGGSRSIAAAAVTNESGQYALTNIAAGSYELVIFAASHAHTRQAVEVTNGIVTANASLALEIPLNLVVKSESGNTPLEDVLVEVFDTDDPSAAGIAGTDASGRAGVGGLGAGTFDVRITIDVYQSKLLAAHDHNSAADVNVLLPVVAAVVSGNATESSGGPLAYVTVNALAAGGRVVETTESGYDGAFALTHLPPGTYTLEYECLGFAKAVRNNVVVAGNVTAQDATLALQALPDPDGIDPVIDFFFNNAPAQMVKTNLMIDQFATPRRGAANGVIDYHTVGKIPPLSQAEQIEVLRRCPKVRPWMVDAIRRYERKEDWYKLWEQQFNAYKGNLIADGAVVGLMSAKLAGQLARLALPLHKVLQARSLYQNLFAAVPALDGIEGAYQAYNTVANKGLPEVPTGNDLEAAKQFVLDMREFKNNLSAPGNAFREYVKVFNYVRNRDEVRLAFYKLPVDLFDMILQIVEINNQLDEALGRVVASCEQILKAMERYQSEVVPANIAYDVYEQILKSCGGNGIYPEPEGYKKGIGPINTGPGPGPGGPDSDGSGPYGTFWFRPKDPNEKRGPEGFGIEKFVSGGQTLTYTILCENQSTATAPVQRLTINDQLDANLDLRTFRIHEIVLGETRIEIPDNRTIYSGRTELGEDQGGIFIDVFAGIDIFTGLAFFKATATDPITGDRPVLPELGFMPPNDATQRGEGHMVYSIAPKAGIPSGTQILNKATIIFDALETIETNTVSNTVDSFAPTSSVSALAAQIEVTTVDLSWSGGDETGGSGLRDFDVYVSDNGGEFVVWQRATAETSAQFTGSFGHTYRFYSIARDNVENVEAAPATPDATVAMVAHINQAPTASTIPDLAVLVDAVSSNVDLTLYFDDLEDGTNGLSYSVANDSNTALFADASIVNGVLTLQYTGTIGESTLTIRATDTGALSTTASFKVTVSELPKVAPSITSSLSDTATRKQAYSYTITATGTTPMTFAASPLPAGLALSNDTISGTPMVVGAFDIVLTATNEAGSDSKTLHLIVASGGANNAPEISSGPSANPNPATKNSPVQFSAAAADADQDALVYTWNFGDGESAEGSNVSHTYAVPGLYAVIVVVSDGELTDTATLRVVVNAAPPGSVTDEFSVKKASIKFNFAKPLKDALGFLGTVTMPSNLQLEGAPVRVIAGSLERNFTLTSKGTGGDKINVFKLALKPKKGSLYTAAAFTFTLKNQNLFDSLKDLGFKDDDIKAPVTIRIPLILQIRDIGHLTEFSVQYTAKKGKTGSAK